MKLKCFLLAVALAFLSSNIFAVPGDPDLTFNGTGRLLTGIGESSIYSVSNSLAVQPNGKIVGVSNYGIGFGTGINLFRLNTTGTFDTTFGSGGKTVITVPDWDRSMAVAFQPDGKILVTGGTITSHVCATVRVNANGSLDTSFNGTGVATTSLGPGGSCYPSAIAVQTDGKVVIGGIATRTTTGNAWLTARYNSDGTPDTGYGSGGVSTTPFLRDVIRYGGVQSLLIQPDGKMLLCGTLNNPPQWDFGVARFDSVTGFDPSFGTGGFATIASPPNEFLAGAVLQPDGKIIFGGNRFDDFTLARMNPDGSTDTSFGSGGFSVTTEAERGIKLPNAVVLQPDGKILVGGAITADGLLDYAVARYNADGSMDQLRPAGKASARGVTVFGGKASVLQPLWGSGGIASFGYPLAEETLYGMAIDAIGRVVVMGHSRFQAPVSDISLVRFLSDSPPAANIFGTIRTASGMPIRNVTVVLSEGPFSEPRYALSNQFGLYAFTDIPVTERYSISISSKRFNFTVDQKIVTLLHDEESVDFTAEP